MTNDSHALTVRIYIEDTDAGGIVYYVNYLKFMERARTDFLRSLGFDKQFVVNDDWLLVVHSLQVNYHQSARLDDLLQVTARPLSLGAAQVQFEQKVWRGGELLCSAHVKVVSVSRHTGRAMRIPAALRRALSGFMQ